ncbi:MAG: hypothetical protein K6T65_05235 [Peptococcaceae bacterium]|nr:hypothetical protein [Peptococcaceae bacterium]
MADEKTYLDRGEIVLDLLTAALQDLENHRGRQGMSDYMAYLHGQIYAMAAALRIIYPGPGNLGERAALAVRPALTEHACDCTNKTNR